MINTIFDIEILDFIFVSDEDSEYVLGRTLWYNIFSRWVRKDCAGCGQEPPPLLGAALLPSAGNFLSLGEMVILLYEVSLPWKGMTYGVLVKYISLDKVHLP